MQYLHNRLTADDVAFQSRLRAFAKWQEQESRRLQRREHAKRWLLRVTYWSLWAIVAFTISYFALKGIGR